MPSLTSWQACSELPIRAFLPLLFDWSRRMVSRVLTRRPSLPPSTLDSSRRDYDDYFKAYSTAMMASRSERANLIHGGKSLSFSFNPVSAAHRTPKLTSAPGTSSHHASFRPRSSQ